MGVDKTNIDISHFSAGWEKQGAAFTVTMRGNADMAVQDGMTRFLD
jgi:hypothetical protein